MMYSNTFACGNRETVVRLCRIGWGGEREGKGKGKGRGVEREVEGRGERGEGEGEKEVEGRGEAVEEEMRGVEREVEGRGEDGGRGSQLLIFPAAIYFERFCESNFFKKMCIKADYAQNGRKLTIITVRIIDRPIRHLTSQIHNNTPPYIVKSYD